MKYVKIVAITTALIGLIALVSLSGIGVSACSSINVGLNIFSPLATCTTTITISTVTTATTTVGGNTPYSWGLWVAVLLLIAVIALFFLLRGRNTNEK